MFNNANVLFFYTKPIQILNYLTTIVNTSDASLPLVVYLFKKEIF